MKKPDWVFKCKKCENFTLCSKTQTDKMLRLNCPTCGEEPLENWILSGEGNWEKKVFNV